MGVPMRVIETDGVTAICERRGERQRVSVLLLEKVEPGDEILVFLGSAVRSLDADEARQIDNALEGLAAALNGEEFEHLFADIGVQEPALDAYADPRGATASGPEHADERILRRPH
jgi:hydrogenase expression/formation protein HypC